MRPVYLCGKKIANFLLLLITNYVPSKIIPDNFGLEPIPDEACTLISIRVSVIGADIVNEYNPDANPPATTVLPMTGPPLFRARRVKFFVPTDGTIQK